MLLIDYAIILDRGLFDFEVRTSTNVVVDLTCRQFRLAVLLVECAISRGTASIGSVFQLEEGGVLSNC